MEERCFISSTAATCRMKRVEVENEWVGRENEIKWKIIYNFVVLSDISAQYNLELSIGVENWVRGIAQVARSIVVALSDDEEKSASMLHKSYQFLCSPLLALPFVSYSLFPANTKPIRKGTWGKLNAKKLRTNLTKEYKGHENWNLWCFDKMK